MNRNDAGFRLACARLACVTAILLFCVLAFEIKIGATADTDPNFRVSTVQIVGADGVRHEFSVEVADTEALRQRGLMFRRELAADHGMLLWYDKPRVVTIWMKNTWVALDVLFIDVENRIVRIAADARPLSETLMTSGVPVRAVLEIPAGQAKALGIEEGNSVVFVPEHE